jgi:hypothetical protein
MFSVLSVVCCKVEVMQGSTADCGVSFLDCRHVTAVLRSIPNEAFADSFQKLYESCQLCVVKDGDYFEGQQS